MFKYPLVTIAEKGYLYFVKEEKDLLYTTYQGFKSGYYNNLVIIDSEGRRYVVKESVLIQAKSNWFLQLKYFLGVKIKVKLILDSSVEQLSLSDFKDYVLKLIRRDSGYSEIEGKLDYVNKASRIHDIIAYLTDIYYKNV